MITKKQFCQMIIEDYCRDCGVNISDSLVTESSTLAVCMEYLGLIKESWAKDYAQTRGGILYTYWDKDKSEACILSTREFIDLLPENCE